MKMLYALAIASLAISSSAQQGAQQRTQQRNQQQWQQMTVGDLRDVCTARDDAGRSACRFYILGATDGIGLAAGEARDRNHFCIPEGVSPDDVAMIVKRAMAKYIAAFPGNLGKPAISLVGAALMQAFPCRQSQGPM